MRTLARTVLVCCIACCSAQAVDVHRFSLRTTELLGRELYERSQQGAPLSDAQQHAERAALSALPNLDKRYRFVVLNNPDTKGFLVYALRTTRNASDVVMGVHYRVTVSSDGKVQRVDPLSAGDAVIPGDGSALPIGSRQVGWASICMVSTQPLETHVYLTLLHKQPCFVRTSDGTGWSIENGKIRKYDKIR